MKREINGNTYKTYHRHGRKFSRFDIHSSITLDDLVRLKGTGDKDMSKDEIYFHCGASGKFNGPSLFIIGNNERSA